MKKDLESKFPCMVIMGWIELQKWVLKFNPHTDMVWINAYQYHHQDRRQSSNRKFFRSLWGSTLWCSKQTPCGSNRGANNVVVYGPNFWTTCGGFHKWWVPLNHPVIDGIFHYKPSILGYPYFRKPPYIPDLQTNSAFNSEPIYHARRAMNGRFIDDMYLSNMVMFHSYIQWPEGTGFVTSNARYLVKITRLCVCIYIYNIYIYVYIYIIYIYTQIYIYIYTDIYIYTQIYIYIYYIYLHI